MVQTQSLACAERNPYYHMATLYGAQQVESVFEINQTLHRKNTRAWNGWMAAALSDAQRAELTSWNNQAEVAPFCAAETDAVLAQYRRRCGDSQAQPPPPGAVNFENICFKAIFVASGFVFAGDARFRGARFLKPTSWRAASFLGVATFREVCFMGYADFTGAHFESGARFQQAHFKEADCFQDITCTHGEPEFFGVQRQNKNARTWPIS